MSAKAAMRERIAAAMRTGGFADAVKAQGAPLERVRRYVESFTREEPPRPLPQHYPDYPGFPGLRNEPFTMSRQAPR